MNKKSAKRLIFVPLILLVLLCGTVFAYMFHQTNLQENQFTPASVSCVVHEQLNGTGEYTSGTHGADSKTSIKVENTGNIDCYIRVRFVSYWVNKDGQVMSKASEMPSIQVKNGWAAGSCDTYYYRSIVKPDTYTTELLAAPITLKTSEEGYFQVLEVFAEAIQSNPADAADQSWSLGS